MRTRRDIFLSMVRENSTPKIILGACWGARTIACHFSPSLNIDLIDTHLDVLDTDTLSILLVFIMSSRRLQDMSSRHLQEMSSRRLQDMSSWCLQDVFKTSSALQFYVFEDVFKASSRRLQEMSSRRLQDMSSWCLQDVFKTSSRHALKTCWRRFQAQQMSSG